MKKLLLALLIAPFVGFAGEEPSDEAVKEAVEQAIQEALEGQVESTDEETGEDVAADTISAEQAQLQEYLQMMQKVNSFQYDTGEVNLGDGVAVLHVPAGYKYLNAADSKYVLEDLWGNLPQETWGLIFPDTISPLSTANAYAIEITYEESGYIDDEDAEEIDYDETLEGMIDDQKETNKMLLAQGLTTMDIVGWAQPPFYDHEAKKLHWALNIAVDGSEENVLNYKVRILGRKGTLNMNVIGDMSVLPKVNEDISKFIDAAEFKPGFTYAEFDPDLDEVAAYGIGGLIAGKVLAKVGFFGLLAKFGKVIVVGIGAAIAGFVKFFKKDKTA